MKKSPLLAFLLAFIPGFGHMYLGYRVRGFLYPIFFFGGLGLAFVTGVVFRADFLFVFFALVSAMVWGVNMLDMVFTLLTRTQPPTQQSTDADDQAQDQPTDLNQNERFFTILLSFIPGVGHFQLGLTQRGLTLLTGFFGILTMIFFVTVTTGQEGFLIFLLALPIIWIYNLFDAIQQLNKKQAGEQLVDKTIMDDLESFREEGKKSKMLATALSIFPGAGHMYLGLQKRGLQLMAAFLLSIYILDVLHLSLFLFIIPIIWFFSFFDALQSVNRANSGELEDVPIINYLINHQKLLGVVLLVLGFYYLFDAVLFPNVAEYLRVAFDIHVWQYYRQYFQVTVVCLLFIGGGIKLITGSKRKNKGDSK